MLVFQLTAGQNHELVMASSLITQGAIKRVGRGRPRLYPKHVVADGAYSSLAFRQFLRVRKIKATIKRPAHQKRRWRFDKSLYKTRNRVERFINRLKQCRRIATRYEKRACYYSAMLTIASIILWL
jgi:transposase